MNLFRVAFTHQEDDGRGVRRRVVRQAFNPVLINTTALCNGVHVIGQRQRDHVGFDAVDDRRRLFARATVRLANHHVIAGFLFVVGRKGFVVLIVKLTRRIVRHVQ
ncbi:hypothetical protein D3C85_1491220 [compost metagenome]